MAWQLGRDSLPRGPLRLAHDLIEGTIPWTFLVLLTVVKGADCALASWVPPMLLCLLIFSHAMRLRVRAPAIVGALSAALLLVAYFLWMRQRLPDAFASHLVFQSPMQISRAVSLAVGGFIGAFGARYLRDAVGRAEVAVRERELFGKYQIERSVARGGMGEVFEASHCLEGGFERRVAVKLIHAHLAEQERFLRLFRAEAEICSRLAHPNIVQVMDFGRVDESYFLAMEYVDGTTLAAFMNRAFGRRRLRMPEPVVGLLGRELLAGLHHAHGVARGADGQPMRVVHRDLCPQNVLLSRNGEVKITDFGVARALGDAANSQTQTVVGHAGYIAPEQARAEAIDARADLFGVGVILWELLTGRRLFKRDNPTATLLALMNEPILPPSTVRPGLGAAWDQALLPALARDPSERYGSAQEMSRALEQVPSARGEGAARELADLVEQLAAAGDDDEVDEAPTTIDAAACPPSSAG